jgi:hypothetical protein
MSEASASHEPEVRVVVRLHPDVYRKFEMSFGQPIIDKHAQDAGCDAAYKLGIQHVLKRLREDLVTE